MEDFDAVGEALHQGTGDGAFAWVGDFGGVEGGEEFSHGVSSGWEHSDHWGKFLDVDGRGLCIKSAQNTNFRTIA